MHKVFISYHHRNDQRYKDRLVEIGTYHGVFVDRSVDTGDIDERLSDQSIRGTIRDHYLRDSTVTIVLVGAETRRRKHVDWEIYSSMYDGSVNKKSGVIALLLDNGLCVAPHDGEKAAVYPEVTSWISIDSRAEYERRYPSMPERIIDNLLFVEAHVSVAPWSKVESDPDSLRFLIDAAFNGRSRCKYDLSRPMRRANS